ncbi:polymorphic toxin type 17 domain-containing protein [Halomonas sp. H10-59]|uniref:Polymorphic toxin type 17 domain-containing protein n=1 Tax=Halomonas sp. H10-59 TaxID=2950874 RepID=A0AAU7KZ36_9GAMM
MAARTSWGNHVIPGLDHDPLKEALNHRRVITAEPYSEGETPEAVIMMDVEEDSVTVLDVVVQAAYMLPVVGNVMAIGDVARDVVDLDGNDADGTPNYQNVWLWAVLVIDAIGLVPAFGNASRPARAGIREGIQAFARGEGVDIVAQILVNQASGAAMDFLAELESKLEEQKPKLLREIDTIVGKLAEFINNPVDAATQLKLIDDNPEWWNLLEKGKRVVFIAFDRLLEAFGDDRQRLIAFLGQLGGMARSMVNAGFERLLPMIRDLAQATRRRSSQRGDVNHQGTAVTGQRTVHYLSADNRQTTRHEAEPSATPAGCVCSLHRPTPTSPNPVDYVMGDENLWHTDFSVPGLIDVEWTLYYRSSIDELDDSELGARWSSPFHTRFEALGEQLTFIDSLNRALPIAPLEVGGSRFLPRESVTLEHPDSEHYRLHYLDGSQELYRRIGKSGRGERVHFRLVEQRERDGRALHLSYRQGRLDRLTDGAALLLRFHYSSAGLLTKVVRHYPGADVGKDGTKPNDKAAEAHEPEVLVRYLHSADGDLIESRDMRGYTREYQYQHHLVTRYTHRSGLAVELEWDWPGKAQGALPAAHDARCVRNRLEDGSEDTRFEYHRGLWYTRVTDADGVVTFYRYNYHNQIESITHPFHPALGSEHWRWDEHGRLIRHIDGEGRTTHYRYDDQGRLIETVDPQGLSTRIDYDDKGLPVRVTEPDGRERSLRFDERGLPLQEIAPSGRVTTFRHDARGLPTAMTDAAGNTYQYRWNDQGRLTSASDCSRKTTQFRYDHRGWLIERRDAAGHRTHYTRDATGLLLSVEHPDGAIEHFSHDGEGRLTQYLDPTGQRTRYRYNGKGQPIERRDPMGQRFAYHYDRLLRLSALTNQNGDRWQFRYDGGGRLIEDTGFDGRTRHYRYDDGGALIERREGDLVTTFTRDAMGRVLERESQRPGQPALTTRYGYDPLGRLTRAASHHSETRFHFDTADNLIAEEQRHQLPNGGDYSSVTRHTHDALGNRETTTLPDGQTLAWLRYGSGHVHAMTLDQRELMAFERDDLHREVRRHQGSREVESRFDPLGRLIEQHIRTLEASVEDRPRHPTVRRQWHYSANGLLSQVDDNLRGTTRYGYDPLGRLRQASAPGLEEVFAFDPAGNLVDPVPPQTRGEKGNEGTTSDATRWRRGRPRDHLDHGSEERIRLDYPGAPASLSPAMGNLLKRYAGTHYHYDASGNQTRRIAASGETWHYQYDPEHRLIEACHYPHAPAAGDDTLPRMRARYAYDGLGRRVWKEVNRQGQPSELTVFNWDGDLLQSEEHFVGGLPPLFRPERLELARENPERPHSLPIAQRCHRLEYPGLTPERRVIYLFEPDSFVPAAKLENRFEAVHTRSATGAVLYTEYQPTEPTLYSIHTDHLGTPMELAECDGKLAWVGHYRAWGKLTKASDGHGNPSTTDNPLRFQGQYLDEETGLHYNRHRYYDPETGRFTTQDPIGLAGGENLYMYAPNPTGWVDPLGLSRCCEESRGSRPRTKTARIKDAQLPTSGRIRYVPPESWDGSTPIPRGPNRGYLDRFGNEWTKGPSRTAGEPFEWDVQLSRTGREQIGWTTRDGTHANVSLDGKITHR